MAPMPKRMRTEGSGTEAISPPLAPYAMIAAIRIKCIMQATNRTVLELGLLTITGRSISLPLNRKK